MSQIEGALGSASLAGQVVFVAAASRVPATGAGGVRAAMARAARLLELDGAAAPAGLDASAAPARSLRTPARRRTRRYGERQRLVSA
jgi:hypothetical protein